MGVMLLTVATHVEQYITYAQSHNDIHCLYVKLSASSDQEVQPNSLNPYIMLKLFLFLKTTFRVGNKISTKKPGKVHWSKDFKLNVREKHTLQRKGEEMRLDITREYKYEEGTVVNRKLYPSCADNLRSSAADLFVRLFQILSI